MAMTLMIALMIILFVINVPVSFIFLSGTALFCFFELPITVGAQRLVWSLDGFILLTVPFFLLVGIVMNKGGITDRIFDFAKCLVGRVPGGLAHVNILASMIFAGMSGSANADAAGLGVIEIKVMEEAGYPRAFSAAVTAASAIIGPIIPPSIILVLYGAISGVSVGAMLLSGIIPGILIGAGLMVVSYIISVRRKYPTEAKFSFSRLWLNFKKSFWALMAPLILIGGIFSGLFTPTEAGAVAATYSILIAMFVYKELTIKELPGIFIEVGLKTSAVIFLVGAAKVVGWILAWKGVPAMIANFIIQLNLSYVPMLIVVNIILLIAGMFVSGYAILAIMVPLMIPIATSLGIDLVHFGLLVCFNLTIGSLTPPFGTVGYTTTLVAKVPYIDFLRELWPFLIGLIVVLFIVTFVPWFSLAIPRAVLG